MFLYVAYLLSVNDTIASRGRQYTQPATPQKY